MVGKRLLMLLVAVLRLSFQPELTQKTDPWTKNMAHMSTVLLTIVSIFVYLDINSSLLLIWLCLGMVSSSKR